MQVQAELVRRRVVHVSPTGKKRNFSCNHCFAQMVSCGDCGELYRRVHWNNHANTLSPDGIQARLEELQKELIKKANNKQDYDAIADEIFRLRDQKEQSEVDSHQREEAMNRIKELQDFISGQETDITEFDEALAKKLIEKITVFADHFTVEFKSGITIDIEA